MRRSQPYRIEPALKRAPNPTGSEAKDSSLPAPASGATTPPRLAALAETAKDYAKASSSENTRKAYASDWRHFTAWARRQGLSALPPDPQILGLYIAACASGAIGSKPCSVKTIERRLSALAWNFSQRGEVFDRADRHRVIVESVPNPTLRNWGQSQALSSRRRTEVRPILSCLAMADLLSPLRARSRISCVFPMILAGRP